MAATPSRLGQWRQIGSLLVLLSTAQVSLAQPQPGTIELGSFRFDYAPQGISALANRRDPFGATIMPTGGQGSRGTPETATLDLDLSYRLADQDDWSQLQTRERTWSASPVSGQVTYSNVETDDPLQVVESFTTDGVSLDWSIELEAVGDKPIHIGDLSIRIPMVGPRGSDPHQIFERGFLNHRFISGSGSFVYFVRASGAPPFLLLTVRPGTKLEYSSGGERGTATVYVHSEQAGQRVTGGTWRQEHTALDLAPGQRASYGFRFQFADSYQQLRQLIYQQGLFDIRVVPGMTVPDDLMTRVALHTKADIESVQPEFPDHTDVIELGEPQPDYHLYQVAFHKLGENLLTINHDGGRKTFLEFFVTEPLETLIKKRAAFIVNKQQIKDASKWYDGVYGPYDMRNRVTRTLDDPDIFVDRMVYVLTCDDPGLCKAPFLAAKNVIYPNRAEIKSLEYYLKNFVWGGLQRTDSERPYPFGIYGTPNWCVNRDPQRRKTHAHSLANQGAALRDLTKAHVWRSYDYPHVVMLYFHMYQIAKQYPNLSSYLDAAGYLQRAWQTARAFYIYPYEIYPEYYETYKWGLYNELVVLDLIAALEAEGFSQQAMWLRNQWEIKAKYFVYDDPYPYRSEYPFDRTAFESTYALAKYGATHDMQPDRNLWYDVQREKYYSHPFVRREHSRAFMDRQLAAGLAVRGWLNAAYYRLGSDRGLSYMAVMGGEGILDYGLNFAREPWDWLQLGYASYLSSWCLVNSGRADTNYGFWYPGPENDGAAGWQFQSAKVGEAWMGSSYPGGVRTPRGPWWYDGEIDLGYGAALRMAATVVTQDPIFGWFAYGAAMSDEGDSLLIEPRDGIRRRLRVVIPNNRLPLPNSVRRLQLELGRDRFASHKNISLNKELSKLTFTLENVTRDQHFTELRLSLPLDSQYELRHDGQRIELIPTDDWDFPCGAELEMNERTHHVELVTDPTK